MHDLSQQIRSLRILGPMLVFLLLLAVACGSSAAPDTSAPAKAAPAAAAVPTAVPGAKAEPAAPAESKVNPGKLTWMIGGWGSERFDYTFDVGGSNNYIRWFGGFLVETDHDGQLIPGIATDWSVAVGMDAALGAASSAKTRASCLRGASGT